MNISAAQTQLTYANVEAALVEALPELRSAYEQYLRKEGPPGEYPGSYVVFEQMFACYMEILLAMPSSPGRACLLRRAFEFIDEMLNSEFSLVRELAFLTLYERQELWWYSRALPFLSLTARAELDASEAKWRAAEKLESQPQPEREINDLYGTRYVVLRELAHEGIDVARVPGISVPESCERFASLKEAQQHPEGVIFLACYGITDPYVVCPARSVACTEVTLVHLVRDLADSENRERNQGKKTTVSFLRVAVGERVWNMDTHESRHARYQGTLWIHDLFVTRGLETRIKAVLQNAVERLI